MAFDKQSINIKGGRRPGAGRKKGIPNKKTAELKSSVESSGITPLDYLINVMRDEINDQQVRMDAAKAAAPYVHSRLSAVEVNAHVTNHEDAIDELE